MSSNNLYDILEIKKEASHNEIKKQYKILALKWHPDKNQSNKVFAENKFKEISKAYEILGDPDKKKLYDSNKNFANDQISFQVSIYYILDVLQHQYHYHH